MEEPIVWITGASSGIGRAIAHRLASKNMLVVLSARRIEILREIVEGIRESGGHATALQCDVTKETDVEWAIKSIKHTFGEGPDILVNNAGISPYADIDEMTTEMFDRVIETNLVGNFLCAKAVLPEMIRKGKGVILQMLSIASIKPFSGGTAYGSSKFGALGFSNALREEVRSKGIKVISVMPGAVETESWSEEERVEFRGRMMQPEDIAASVAHILEDPDRMMTEEIILRPIGGDL
jgi:NADP-dependent 3-hydroxy acid dehydrogenase YdfG